MLLKLSELAKSVQINFVNESFGNLIEKMFWGKFTMPTKN